MNVQDIMTQARDVLTVKRVFGERVHLEIVDSDGGWL